MSTPKRAITGFGLVMLVVLAFAITFYTTSSTVQVSGVSMLPTFKDGQRVFVSRAYWAIGGIHDGDVVVIRDDGPTGYIIKRVHRMAGELVEWRYQPENTPVSYPPKDSYRVPEGTVYVLGDNRDQSEDSRKFGPVPLDKIIGKVVVKP